MNNNDMPKVEESFVGFFSKIFGGISFVFLYICRVVYLGVKFVCYGAIFPVLLIVRLFGNVYIKGLAAKKEKQLKKDEIRHQKEVERIEKAKAKREEEAKKAAEKAALEPPQAQPQEQVTPVTQEQAPELTRINEAMKTGDAIEIRDLPLE